VEPVECLMVDAMDLTGGAQLEAIPEEEYEQKIEEVYPSAGEDLIDFLQKCKLNNSEAILCPRCSAMFDKKATASLNKYVPFTKDRENWSNKRPQRNKNVIQRKPIHQRLGYKATFVPPNKAPVNQWFHG
ncbi:hypothetical protein A2U01_0058274, partial [Trifolium medium]|nr:hypothetical protein [Trifolium medium]